MSERDGVLRMKGGEEERERMENVQEKKQIDKLLRGDLRGRAAGMYWVGNSI